MRNLRIFGILKRIGTGIILSLFVLSAYEDSFVFSFEHYFSENSHQSTVSSTVTSSNDLNKTDSYDVCGKQHSRHLPCENSCQFTGCLDVVIIPWKGTDWKKHGIKSSLTRTMPPLYLSLSELTRTSHFQYAFSDILDKNSYANLIGIIKNQN